MRRLMSAISKGRVDLQPLYRLGTTFRAAQTSLAIPYNAGPSSTWRIFSASSIAV
jgi:hypothetical protein